MKENVKDSELIRRVAGGLFRKNMLTGNADALIRAYELINLSDACKHWED